MVEHFKHRAASFNDAISRDTLCQQIVTGNAAVGQIDIGGVIDNAAVNFFRHPHIKAAVTCFHMEGRNFTALGRDHRHATIGITEHQHGIGVHLSQYLIYANDHITDSFSTCAACCT
ncbi:hypothetical protein D3C85_1133880 [compost metagenome]